MVEPRIIYREMLYYRSCMYIKVVTVTPIETDLLLLELLLLLPFGLQWWDSDTRPKRFSTRNISRRCQRLALTLYPIVLAPRWYRDRGWLMRLEPWSWVVAHV